MILASLFAWYNLSILFVRFSFMATTDMTELIEDTVSYPFILK
ncbi:MAG: hypothetical protein ACP5LQ_09005 [Candidatus Methanodesulfokora sp.]